MKHILLAIRYHQIQRNKCSFCMEHLGNIWGTLGNIAFVISAYNKRGSTLGRKCYHKRLKAPRCAVSTLGGNCYQQDC